MHGGSAKIFQTVPKDKATILQSGRNKNTCTTCGMSLSRFYKVNHAAKHDVQTKQFCSIHCLAKEKSIEHTSLEDILVVDFKTLKFIDTKSAYYVLGSKKRGVMTKTSKFAFASKEDAEAFMKENAGKIVGFDEAYKDALKDFKRSNLTKYVKPMNTIYFIDKKPAPKSKMNHGNGHMMRGRNRAEIPIKTIWLATDSIQKSKCVKNIEGVFYTTDVNNNIINSKVDKKACTSASFKMPKSGYYKVYYLLKSSDNINVAKYEFKRFDHSNEEIYNKEKMLAKTIKEIPFDILRLRADDETFYSRLHSSEIIKFKVLKDGVAQNGAKVSLETQFGWQKNLLTNKDGIAEFQLIKDYNPPWDKFNKRFREKFIVVATFSNEEKNYKASYTALFTPARSEYQSYSYGLIITIILLLLFSGGIFLYRYRIQKPFKEVTFDE
jgi:nitrous oxide reductase accessory protein NosL